MNDKKIKGNVYSISQSISFTQNIIKTLINFVLEKQKQIYNDNRYSFLFEINNKAQCPLSQHYLTLPMNIPKSLAQI